MAMASTRPIMNETNMPDQIGAVVNPTQSIAESKRLPLTYGWACGWKGGKREAKRKVFNLVIGSMSAVCWAKSSKLISNTRN